VSTLATSKSRSVDTGLVAFLRSQGTLLSLLGVIVLWVVVWAMTRGSNTLEIGGADITDAHGWFTRRAEQIEAAATAGTNPLFAVTNTAADALNWVVDTLQRLFTVAAPPRPVPEVGWLGIVAIAGWVTFAISGWRYVLLVMGSLLVFGFLGVWEASVDTLIVTFVSVGLAVAVGVPIAIWMSHSKVVTAVVTPVLDVMQTMPSFSYLLPIAIIFGIGPAAAVVVIFIYAAPPVIRITAHGIRSISASTLEATDSLGQTTWQRLSKVELPMARKTIIVGVNQTTMAALAMAIIAGYIDSPGLGQNVLSALQRNQLGNAAVAGLAIVLMAIMLDRTTTAASERTNQALAAEKADPKWRRIGLLGGGVLAAVAVWLSHTRQDFNVFPSSPDIGTPIANVVDDFAGWLRSDLSGFTGGWRALAVSAVCLTGIYFLDLWNNAMVTITSVLVATVVVMVVAVVLGVAMGRSKPADAVIRPVLDAAQTIPAFIYLIPILILFLPNRFTAIVAGVIYAVPVATKLIADGIRAVSPTTVEAAESAGTSRLQMITKVQLPMARSSLVLAANQGLLYVLSMVVLGGMVGAGALGGDIVTGFRQTSFVGRGLAAAVAVVLIGIMLDRITFYGAQRTKAIASAH
jgi:glycine betaine/proline transport system permease protein